MISPARRAALVFAVLCTLTLVLRAQNSARELFERARLLEENVATLEQAVRTYEQVVSLAPADRRLVSEARLHVALIRERQGSPAASGLFARVVKEYADQPAAAIARTRTVGMNEIVARRIWSGPGASVDGHPSADGRFLTYVDWSTNSGNVGIRNLSTGQNLLLTHASGDSGLYADDPILSPDNRQVAYIWRDAEIRLVDADGRNDRLLMNPHSDLFSLAWSPDGRHLAVVLHGDDGETFRIGLVATADPATVTTLKSTGWNFPDVGGFSPDSRFLTYSLPHTPPATDGGIFTIAVDGSKERILVQSANEDSSPMWTPDGHGVVFFSNRSGKRALWHVRVSADGSAASDPTLLRPDVDLNLGFARDGSFFYGTRNIQRDVYLGSFDDETLTFQAGPVRLSDRFIGATRNAFWSPDGKSIAYVRGDEAKSVVIRSMVDGAERQLPTLFPLGGPTFGPEWFPDGRTLVVGETDYPNVRAIFRRVDIESGQDSPLFTIPYAGVYGRLQFSPDGSSLFYSFRSPGNDGAIRLIRRNLQTGDETTLYEVTGSDGVGLFGLSLSPDGTQLAFNLNVPASERRNGEGPRALRIVSSGGGAARELMRGSYSCPAPASGQWASKGRFILVVCDDGDRRRLWAVPVAGGERRKLDVVMNQLGPVDTSSNGHDLVFTGSKQEPEVWMISNLLASVR